MSSLKNKTKLKNQKFEPFYICTELKLETKLDLKKIIKLNKIDVPYFYYFDSDNKKIKVNTAEISKKLDFEILFYGDLSIEIHKVKKSFLYMISYSYTANKTIEYGFNKYIKFLNKLFESRNINNKNFSKIDFDIGIEAGSAKGNIPTFTVPNKIISKLKKYDYSISITVYPYINDR